MSALLLKDFYVMWKQTWIFLLLILVFSSVPGAFYSTFAVVYAAMLPYTALAYDERSRWDQFAAMLPYSTRDMVLSKYAFGWIATGLAIVYSFVLQTVLGAFLPGGGSPSVTVLLLSACASVCILDITLPLMFRFGVEKGRLIVFLMIFLVCGSTGAVGQLQAASAAGRYLGLALVPAAILAAALTAVSIPLSIKLYRRKAV